MDNPIADIIREYTSVYNTYVAKQSIFDVSYADLDKLYYALFEEIVTDDESERMTEIFINMGLLLDEYTSILIDMNSLFEDLNILNDKFNAQITETLNVSEYGQQYVDYTEMLKEMLDKIEVIAISCENYGKIIDESMNTLKAKYAEEYQSYMADTSGDSIEETGMIFDKYNNEEMDAIFDKLNNKPIAMFSENILDVSYNKSKELPQILTKQENIAYSEAVSKCVELKDTMTARFRTMNTKYGKSDIINLNLAAVNNIILECDNLISIFSKAVSNPYSWADVSCAQESVYRYEALQNDYKVISNALSDVEKRLLNGSARRSDGSRNVNLEVQEKDTNYDNLTTLTNTLADDINAYLESCPDENIACWIISRYNELVDCVGAYSDARNKMSYSHMEPGFTSGLYGMEDMGQNVVGNLMRECNLIVSEIRRVMN